ncbi:PP2C family protein-serine/threonine phosphatase [Planctomycetota bacterium]
MALSDWLTKKWFQKNYKEDKKFNFSVEKTGAICPYCLELIPLKEDFSDRENKLFQHITSKCKVFKGKNTPSADIKSLAKKKKDLEIFSFIRNNSKKSESWRVKTKSGIWYCPYCVKPTQVIFSGKKEDVSKFIEDVAKHLDKCFEYSRDPNEFKSADQIKTTVLHENKMHGTVDKIIKKMADNDERYTQMDSDNNWICPFCLHPVPGINLSTELLKTVNAPPQIAHHLLEQCPADTDEKNLKSLNEVIQAAESFTKKAQPKHDPAAFSETAYFGELRSEIMALKKEMGQDDEIKKSLEKARVVVDGMLPSENPQIEGFEFATYFQACSQIGGDFYDFIPISKDRLAVVVGDVSGHGLESALVMGMAKKALSMRVRENDDIIEALSKTNSDIYPDMDRKTFITIFFGVLDIPGNSIQFLRAGHNYSIIYKKQSGKVGIIKSPGMPLGVADGSVFLKSLAAETFTFEKGDIFVQYTDGLTEAMDPTEEEYGMERFVDAIEKYGKYDADYLVTKTINSVTDFAQGYPQTDDISMIVIKRNED